MGGLSLGEDTPLWSACTSDYCAYLYETPPCGLSIKVTTKSGFPLFQQPFDLAISNQACAPPLGGCTYCIELHNLTKSTDGNVYPCVYLTTTCSGTTTSSNIGCVSRPNNLAQCLAQGCPSGCSGHGTCLDTGKCQCNSGWYGDDCSDEAPLYVQCVPIPQYGDVCVSLETQECAIDATVYFKDAPSLPLYNKLIEAPAFNTYFSTASCFNIMPNCGACLYWDDFTLNQTYAFGCPNVNASCTGLPSFSQSYGCFEDDSLVPACFGTCPEDCSDHGDCIRGACVCNDQYKGPTCAIPRCDQVFDCYRHGECVAPNSCQCDSGYSGDNCATAVCDQLNNCNGHGACNGPNNCTCFAGFAGNACTEVVCPYECKNGGQCSAGTCKCASGWKGADCSTVSPDDNGHTPKAKYVVIGVVVGLIVAGAAGVGAFFVWRWRNTQRKGRLFTAFDDGLIQVPDEPESDSQ
eukprot:Phypoly_transcript_07156.p1 GENE.Phypoly_transcript_07156~~Phypoly_transcript_07156.p1  ORF type:complete len:481 (+),score=18.05 Phypoly_transcript_07156:55-1443(+)